MSFELVAIFGEKKGTSWKLDRVGLVIGRDHEVDIVLTNSIVSRRHCHVCAIGDEVHLKDLQSLNPVLVNGFSVTESVLQVGDELSIGGELFLISQSEERNVRPASISRGDDTVAWKLSEYVSIPADTTEARALCRPSTIPDLILAHELGRELGVSSSLDSLLATMCASLQKRFSPNKLWIMRVHSPDEHTFLKTEHGDPAEAPMDAIGDAIREQRGIMAAMAGTDRGHVTPGVALVAPACLGGVPIAALVLYRSAPSGGYQIEDLQMLVVLAQILAPFFVAVDRADAPVPDVEGEAPDPANAWSVVGESKSIRQMRSEIARAARTDLNVLVTGETGTGKELAARMLHALSDRCAVPLVTVNCAAIPRDLFLSVLFGHERGAFTGAHQASEGLVHLADGGVLFLDEIGDLSLENQSALLRFIETGTYRRVGAEEELFVDVRVIAATNREITRAVAQGTFRQDLYHRINGFEIHIPPLRKRPSDIPILAEHFFRQNKARATRPLIGIAPETMDHLSSRSWPGNVRELRNCILRAISIARHDTLRPEDVCREPERSSSASPEESPLTLAEVEKSHITSIMRHCEGNVRKAADILQIGRTTLYKKIAEYGIEV